MTLHTLYQAQLPHDHLFTNNKKQLLAKYWIESNLGLKMSSNDFYESLKDGEILVKIIEYLVDHEQLPNEYRASICDLKDPVDKINLFLKAAKDFGLQSYHLFCANDLINGDNINNIASTILILAHVYSCKRFAGKSTTNDQPKRSESYTIGISSLTDNPICKSKSEADLQQEQGSTQERKEEQPINIIASSPPPPQPFIEPIGEPPYDIERPNCVPGFGSHNLNDTDQSSINSLEYEDMYDTHQSHTPSTSGDSGYGTTRNKTNEKTQDLFEALFAPTTPKHQGGRLSLLFSKAKKEQPHFVKFQTWHKNTEPVPKSSVSSRPHEHKLFQSLARTKSLEWQNKLPPVIKVETPKPVQQRARRRTDASLMQNSPVKQHTRSRSIGSVLETLSDKLDLYDDDKQLVASYKLGNVIGKGHFGTVYRALDLISGNTVAIKQVSLQDARKSDIEDMMQEASLLKSLTHSNIVKYEGFIQTSTHMNIVLEYVENGSLLHTLKHFGNSLPEHLVASYCHDILQGLAYLHQKDVVHCDLKAANILTTKTGDVKLSDFGVSLNLKLKKQQDNMVAGTPFWMSPEVIELKGASVQSDIWSLGCTIIELCTGKPPYADLLTMTAMFKIVEDDTPPLPQGLSDDLLDFLKLCFKKNPIERPKAMHLLHHPWILQNAKSVASHPDQVQVNSTLLKSYKPPKSKNTHKHNLTICSFPSGTVQCKICNTDIHNEAYVCKDFCGYISHSTCHSQTSSYLLSRARRTSDPKGGLPTIKPTSSVSSQLKEKFSFARKSTIRHSTHMLSNIIEDGTFTVKKTWWKKSLKQ